MLPLHAKSWRTRKLLFSDSPRWLNSPQPSATKPSTAATEQAVRSRAPLGSLILLERPFRPVTLSSAVRTALAARTRQYEIRDHLREREAAEQVLLRVQNVLESKMEERTEALRKLSSRNIWRPPKLTWRSSPREKTMATATCMRRST